MWQMRTQAGEERLTRAVYPHLFGETGGSDVTLRRIQSAQKVSANSNSPPTAVGYRLKTNSPYLMYKVTI